MENCILQVVEFDIVYHQRQFISNAFSYSIKDHTEKVVLFANISPLTVVCRNSVEVANSISMAEVHCK